jgi:hypothetical protein
VFGGLFHEAARPAVDQMFRVGIVTFGGAADIRDLGGVVAEGVTPGASSCGVRRN